MTEFIQPDFLEEGYTVVLLWFGGMNNGKGMGFYCKG